MRCRVNHTSADSEKRQKARLKSRRVDCLAEPQSVPGDSERHGKLFFRLRRFFAEPFPLFRLRLFHRYRRRFFFFGRWFFWLRSGFFLFCAWLDLFSFRLLFFLGFFFDDLCAIDPLDECHGSRVALALTELDNACVTAVALRRSRRDVVEEFLDRVLLPQCRQGGPARMNRSFLAEGHHLFRERSNRFRFGQRRLDTLMFDQRANLIRQQRFAVLSRAAKLDRLFLVSHNAANVVVDPTITLWQPTRSGLRHQRSPAAPQDPDQISFPDPTQDVAVCL